MALPDSFDDLEEPSIVCDYDSTSSIGSTHDDEEDDLEETARIVMGPDAPTQNYPGVVKCFLDKGNQVVHRLSQKSFGRFVCGVKVTENYEAICGDMFFRFPTCGKCLKDVQCDLVVCGRWRICLSLQMICMFSDLRMFS